jgi:hypothetical protein
MTHPIPERGTDAWRQLWLDLGEGLSARGIETTGTFGKRPAVVSDFMLMHVDGNGGAGFKHCQTRNYVFISYGKLIVPKTDEAFMRGQF